MLAEALERGLELLDALVDGHVERGQRPRRHRSGRRQAMAHLEALDGVGKRIVVGAGRLVGGEIAADDQALAQQFVMRLPVCPPRIWRRKESPAIRRAPRCRSSSARLRGSVARCLRRRSGHAGAPAPPPSVIPALTKAAAGFAGAACAAGPAVRRRWPGRRGFACAPWPNAGAATSIAAVATIVILCMSDFPGRFA